MALSDYAAYRAARPYTTVLFGKNNLNTIDGRCYSRWVSNPLGGVAGTTPVALDATSVGALKGNPINLDTWVKVVTCASHGAGTVVVCDRLCHQGGLDGTVVSTQTTNFPTATLPRYTDGVGVMAAVEVITAIGTTATTYSISYTNSSGTSGRTSPLQTIGGASDRGVQLFVLTPLQIGDIGIRSVESLTLTGTTGTAGNMGVTLFKPLFSIPMYPLARSSRLDAVRHLGAMFERIPANACLFVINGASTVGATRAAGSSFELIKQV